MSDAGTRRAGWTGAAERVIELWALAGGLVLAAVVAVNVATVVGAIFGAPFPGDFELTEMGVAVAAFAFLPYCQISRANVTADIFTSRASRAWVARFSLAGSATALAFALLLLWRMWEGMLSQREYDYMTAILQAPLWWAYVPCLASLALLAVAAVVTMSEEARGARSGGGFP